MIICRFVSSVGPDIAIYSISSRKIDFVIRTPGTGIRAFDVIQTNEFIAFVDVDGSISIDRLFIHQENNVLTFTDNKNVYRKGSVVAAAIANYSSADAVGLRVTWNPSLELVQVAVPSCCGSVILLTKLNADTDWIEDVLVATSDSDSTYPDINIAVFSEDGKHLVTSDLEGKILVWDSQTKNVQRTFHCSPIGPLLDIAWGRGDDYMMAITKTSIARIPEPYAAEKMRTAQSHSLQSSDAGKDKKDVTVAPRRLQRSSQATKAVDDQDEDITFEDNVEEIKRSIMNEVKAKEVRGDSRDVDEDGVEDLGVEDESPDIGEFVHEQAPWVAAPLQPPFQPSSTVPDDKSRCYLVWNCVGTITSRQDNINRRIEIKFSNTNGPNKQEAFPDNDEFTMAALCQEGALFANNPKAQAEDDPDERDPSSRPGSVIHYHAFPGHVSLHGANDNFTVTLANGEVALAVAVGSGWAAVATSRRLLRIFSSTGLQLSVTWLLGPVLCMTGHADTLAIFYHRAAPLDAPNVDVVVLKLTQGGTSWQQVCSLPVPLTAGAKLSWAGFSYDGGYLVIMDSEGLLSTLLRYAGWSWVPVLDTHAVRKSIDHEYWPIGVKNGRLLYVLLNGESKPSFHPQPIVSNKPFHMLIVENVEGGDRRALSNDRVRQVMWDGMKSSHATATLQDPVELDTSPLEHLEQYVAQCEVRCQQRDRMNYFHHRLS